MKDNRTTSILLAVLLIAGGGVSGRASAATLYVQQGGTIQAAIDLAADGDTIIVCDGIHSGPGNRDIDFKGKAITVKSAGAERGERAATTDTCIINCGGSDSDPHRGFIFQTGEGPGSRLEGFTIMMGYIIGELYDFDNGAGAAILCTGGSDPTITNNHIMVNHAVGPGGVGGGIACWNSSPVIDDNLIELNIAQGPYGGAGIYCYFSSPIITRNQIKENWAAIDGGGIYCIAGTPLIADNDVLGNEGNNGGGLCNWDADSEILNNVFALNTAGTYGGGIFCRYGAPNITNCTLTENIAGVSGRELAAYEATVDVLDSIIWWNDENTALAAGTLQPKVSGTGGSIAANATDLSATDPGTGFPIVWTGYDIDQASDVCIISNPTGDVQSGTYTITSVFNDRIVLSPAAGIPGGAPIGTCDFWVGPTGTGGYTDTVYDVYASSSSTVIMRYCVVSPSSEPQADLGSLCVVSPDIEIADTVTAEDMFVNPGVLTGDPLAPAGSEWIPGFNWHLATGSRGIDFGCPISPYPREPHPNGQRVNAGAYGNTPEATASARLAGYGVVTIQGPATDLIRPDPGVTTELDIEIYGVDMDDVAGIQTILEFIHEDVLVHSEKPYEGTTGFTLPPNTDANPDPNYLYDSEIEPGPSFTPRFEFRGGDDDSRIVGFVADNEVDMASGKVLLMTVTYEFEDDVPLGVYTIGADDWTSFLGPDGGLLSIDFEVQNGTFTIVEAAATPPSADANGDSAVNILDMLFIRNRLGQDVNTGNNADADVNGDGVINVLDLLYVRQAWNP